MSSQRASGRGRGRAKAPTARREIHLASPQQPIFVEPVSRQPAQGGTYMSNTFTGMLGSDNIGGYSGADFLDEYGSGHGYTVPMTPTPIDVDENSPDVEEIYEADVPQSSRRKAKQVEPKLEGDGKKWDPFEDIILSRIWCNLSESTYESKSNGYWTKITRMYNEEVVKQGGLPRSLRPLQNRWGKSIRAQGIIWFAADRHCRAKRGSGENETKLLQKTEREFVNRNPAKTPFQFLHVIDILMGCQKFVATCTAYLARSFHNTDAYTPTPPTSQSSHGSVKRSIDSSNATDEATSPMKETIRPPGVKATKAKKQMLFNESPANQQRLKQKAE